MEATRHDVTVLDVLEVLGTSIKEAADVAAALGTTMEGLRTMAFNRMGTDSLRAMAVTLRRSSDELLAIADAPEAERERRKAQAQALTDLVACATIACGRMRGAAQLLEQTDPDEGIDRDALDLLADTLMDAADELERARRALDARVA